MKERSTYIKLTGTKHPEKDYLLGIMQDARATTLQRVENIHTHELHWQPYPGWNTIGALLSHIISNENIFRIAFIEGRELTPAEIERWLPGNVMGKYLLQLINGQPLKWYIAQLKLSRKNIIAAIKKIPPGKFRAKRKGYNPKTGCNLAWILYHMAEDEVHHRGQISMIRKMYQLQFQQVQE